MGNLDFVFVFLDFFKARRCRPRLNPHRHEMQSKAKRTDYLLFPLPSPFSFSAKRV
jgi:hypothetical protein